MADYYTAWVLWQNNSNRKNSIPYGREKDLLTVSIITELESFIL